MINPWHNNVLIDKLMIKNVNYQVDVGQVAGLVCADGLWSVFAQAQGTMAAGAFLRRHRYPPAVIAAMIAGPAPAADKDN